MYAQNQRMGNSNNMKGFGSKKTKWPKSSKVNCAPGEQHLSLEKQKATVNF
jgi:hypothetical protein